MKVHRFCKLPLLVCSVPVLLVSGWGSMPVPLVDIATKSQLVVLATAVENDDTSSSFDVVKVYRAGNCLTTCPAGSAFHLTGSSTWGCRLPPAQIGTSSCS